MDNGRSSRCSTAPVIKRRRTCRGFLSFLLPFFLESKSHSTEVKRGPCFLCQSHDGKRRVIKGEAARVLKKRKKGLRSPGEKEKQEDNFFLFLFFREITWWGSPSLAPPSSPPPFPPPAPQTQSSLFLPRNSHTPFTISGGVTSSLSLSLVSRGLCHLLPCRIIIGVVVLGGGEGGG